MKARAAVILIQHDTIALSERNRDGRHYFVFPGGKVEVGETPVKAAARESWEELGLEVNIGPMVAEIWYLGAPQFYFLAEPMGGQFGHGSGSELSSTAGSKKGTYLPIWMGVNQLLTLTVLQKLMADLVWKSHLEGWPEKPLIVTDNSPDKAVMA